MSSDSITPLRIDLDRSSPIPLYHQMAKAIEKSIETGELAPGARLENEIALAGRLRVSRPTARRALHELVELGMLVRKRGVGTQVAPVRVRRKVGLTSLFDDLADSGRTPTTKVLEYSVGPGAAEVTNALEIPLEAEVVTVQRLRYADGEPLSVMVNQLSLEIAPSYEELAELGLYAALRTRGIEVHMAQQQIGARTATAAEARILEEKPKAALLTMERTAYDSAGRPIEHGFHVYRASRYSFSTTLFAQ
ncbi:GntR family transcriptional regulator [Pengzhenrongella sicca]|uniref:GntR family transcriptional regulator n=1 Tax=Pengzhenrongella sicca TaxID=2819238 RepID=A0A8A4ZHU1_9MICO|nr:GntR family transcriptional regulator [Pengzhenrongella sicca]QTE30087.1 GntR family transcriptional regulator [Pengzhenrongella sicca]